jgi:hypothetical protein
MFLIGRMPMPQKKPQLDAKNGGAAVTSRAGRGRIQTNAF